MQVLVKRSRFVIHLPTPHNILWSEGFAALKDAYILGRLLSDTRITSANVCTALQVYDHVRRPIAAEVAERSLRLGFLYELHSDYLPQNVNVEKMLKGDIEELMKVVDEMRRIWTFYSEQSPENDWEQASEVLSKL